MGIDNNEVLIATMHGDTVVNATKRWVDDNINERYRPLFVFIDSIVNHKTTLFVSTSGSKARLDDYVNIAKMRNDLIIYMKTFEFDDGSSLIKWIEADMGSMDRRYCVETARMCNRTMNMLHNETKD